MKKCDEVIKMNKWQKYYKEQYGPIRSNKAKRRLALLGNVNDVVTIEFPEFRGNPKHTESYVVMFAECNMPKGIVSVEVLAANLELWTNRGYKIIY